MGREWAHANFTCSMASFSPRTQGSQFGSPYDIIPRITLDTFNPELPRRTVVVHVRDNRTTTKDLLRDGDVVPYGTFFVLAGVDMVMVMAELDIEVGGVL